ncbi:MAG TPA: hypothetical protein VLB67_15380, partial [Acidimicrobiia bacterium]|nr:hypothetical protein [Acidimicrobiia bacterium]
LPVPTTVTSMSTTVAVTWLPTSTTLQDLTASEAVALLGDRSVEPAPIELSHGAFDPSEWREAAGATTREDCVGRARQAPLLVDDRYVPALVARMTHDVFRCLTAVEGLDAVAPTALRRWNGAERWGFGSLSDQVAAEAVVVAYCETKGFDGRALTGSNGFGYAGLFQMGRTEMRRFGESGSSRYDPVDNAVAAANYFIHQYRNRAGWGGWSPWAVVNTNFDDEINNQVKVPVLPRFTSTDPGYRGRPGPELPAWAVDPWSWQVPNWKGTGCPFDGRSWPEAVPVES